MTHDFRSNSPRLGRFLRENPELPILAAAGLAALLGRRNALWTRTSRFAGAASDGASAVVDASNRLSKTYGRSLYQSAELATTSFIQGAQALTSAPVTEAVGRLSADPLALAAAGLAVGVAVGALLPATATEDRLLGEFRDYAKNAATRALNEQMERLRVAGEAAREQLREEIAERDLNAEGLKTMAKHVADAAWAGASHGAEAPAAAAQEDPGMVSERPEETVCDDSDVRGD
jgi:hypothetical protein